MNDVEIRRLQLLENTRNNYSNRHSPPAIHPRYRGAYSSLYGEEEKPIYIKNAWLIRLVIAVCIFALFLFFDFQDKQIGIVDSAFVVREIQRDLLGQ